MGSLGLKGHRVPPKGVKENGEKQRVIFIWWKVLVFRDTKDS